MLFVFIIKSMKVLTTTVTYYELIISGLVISLYGSRFKYLNAFLDRQSHDNLCKINAAANRNNSELNCLAIVS